MQSHKPRILMFVPKYPEPIVGGLEKQASLLVKQLAELGVSTIVLAGRFCQKQKKIERLNRVTIYRFYWSTSKFIRFFTSFPHIFLILILNIRRFDIVHVHQLSNVSFFVIILSIMFKKKTVVKLANVGIYGIPGLRKSKFGILKIKILNKVDKIISMSDESNAELQHIRVPVEKIFNVYNGVQRNTRKVNLPRKPSTIRVLAIGRLSPEKRYVDLLSAWKLVIQGYKREICLDIIGDGPDLQSLMSLKVAQDLQSSVRFLGHIENVEERLPSYDILVNTSMAEGNSNAILEAMNYGLAVIATNVGGTPEIIGDENSSFLVNVGDVTDIAKKIIFLASDDAKRLNYGSDLKARVDAYFDMNLITKNYMRMYKLLIH